MNMLILLLLLLRGRLTTLRREVQESEAGMPSSEMPEWAMARKTQNVSDKPVNRKISRSQQVGADGKMQVTKRRCISTGEKVRASTFSRE